MKLTKDMKVSAFLAYILITLIVGNFMGYALFSYKFQWDCLDKGYTNIGKGYYCSEKYGDNLK